MKGSILSKYLLGLHFNTKDPKKENPTPPPLDESFSETNYDLENPSPTGGPIHDPKSNYVHKYSDKLGKGYLDKFQGARSKNSNFGTEGTDIKSNSSFEKTNLDLENPSPTGGPINDINSGFTHKYTPSNKYTDNYQGARSNNSSFGTEGTDIKPKSIFETTGLDVENPNAGTKQGGTGGPNRTNSSNIPNGQYINIGTNNLFGFKFKNHLGVLYNKEGTPVITKLHQYTPKNTYMSLLRGKPEL